MELFCFPQSLYIYQRLLCSRDPAFVLRERSALLSQLMPLIDVIGNDFIVSHLSSLCFLGNL